jgi:hypothetical protein
MPLVGQSADLRSKQIEQERSSIWNKEALAAYQSRGYRPIYKPDGSIDSEKMAVVGRSLVDANIKVGYAQSMLAGKWMEEDQGDGIKRNVLRNPLGEDVTPNDKNPTVKYYHKMMQDARKILFEPLKEPDDHHVGRVTPETAGDTRGAISTVSTVEPGLAAQDIEEFRGLVGSHLIQSGVPDGPAVASEMAPQDLLEYAAENLAAKGSRKKTTIGADGVITIEDGAAAPAVEPSAGKPYVAGTGFESYLPGYFKYPKEISDALNTHPSVKQWNDAKGTMGTFVKSAAAVPSVTSDQQLAGAVAQLADPASNGITFDFKKLINDKPALEELGRIWQKAAGETAMSPASRQRLVEAGNRIIQAKEEAARPQLMLAWQRWDKLKDSVKATGPVLDEWDMNTLRKQPGSAGASNSPALPPGAVEHEQDGKKGYIIGKDFFAYKQR